MAEMKIAIAEDNRQALDMLGNILESDKEIQVVGKAENGTDAYNIIINYICLFDYLFISS